MIVGLTGGIASGKTVVARIFHLLGASVFMSDDVARESYFDKDIQIRIKEILGPESYKSVTEIDRKYIAAKIFADPALRVKINEVIHPYVGRKFMQFVNENKSRLIIKESALLFEANI